MAQPNKYDPKIRFSNSPYNSRINRIDPVELDNELKRISESINGALKQLELIQRDDGYIADDALGEYKKRIQDETLSRIDNYIPSAVKKVVDDYIKSGKLPNGGSGGSTSPVPPTTFSAVMRGYQLMDMLREANQKGEYVYLEEAEYFIQSTIRISKGNNENVKGIVGKGKGKSIIRFDWRQVVDWNSDTNLTDARLEAGILVNGIDGKELKDFSIRYEGEFYHPKNSYFGSISCINIQNSSNNLVENVEASGANRAGIFLGGTSDKVISDNRNVHSGKLLLDALQNHPRNNVIRGCHTHHNRVGGIVIQNQVSPRIINNVSEYNGHENDGGTGYGITAFSGSVNVDVQITGNTTRKNYRKGIDSHDAYDFIVKDNRSEGDRFFGVAIESRGYPMRKAIVEGNTIIHDPTFRLALDDEHANWEDHRNMDYYRYTAIRVENKSQPSQSWKKQPAKVEIVIKDNDISGIEWDGRGLHRVIEVRNSENADHVRLDGEISGNNIRGTSVHNIFYGQGETPAYNGIGNMIIKNNVIEFDEILDVPFNLAEKNKVGAVGGVFEISGNRITFKKNDAWANIGNFECENRPLIKFNGNTITMPRATKQQFRLVSASGAPKQFFEVMNNIWVTQSTADQIKPLLITRNTVPAGNINVYNNRVNDPSGQLITYDGSTSNPQSKDPSEAPDQPKANIWEDSYVAPKVNISAPESTIKLDWAKATSEQIPLVGGGGSVVKAGQHQPADWVSLVDTAANPKYMRARLLNNAASAGVYPRLNIDSVDGDVITVLMAVNIQTLGGSARVATGLPILGFGLAKSGQETGAGGVVAIRGTEPTHWRLTQTAGVYVDGKPYNNEDLAIGKTYVVTFKSGSAANFVTFGAAFNGNGQVSANTFEGTEVFPRVLSADEIAAVSLKVLQKVKPEVLGGVAPPPPPPPAPQPPAEDKGKNAFFGFGNAVFGENIVKADEGPVQLVSVKSSDKAEDMASWSGMVAVDASSKVATTMAGEGGKASRYIRVDNVQIGEEESIILFPFKVLRGGTAGLASLVISTFENKPVAVASASLSSDGTGWHAHPAAGFTINGSPAKAATLLPFDKWHIAMLRQNKAVDSVRFGTNHVANVWRNMIIGPRTEIATGIAEEEITLRYEALKKEYDIV